LICLFKGWLQELDISLFPSEWIVDEKLDCMGLVLDLDTPQGIATCLITYLSS